MGMIPYRFELSTRDGADVGEVRGASQVAIARGISSIDVVTITLPLAVRHAWTLAMSDEDEYRLRTYLGDVMIFHGDITNSELVLDSTGMGTVVVSFASPAAALNRRLAGKANPAAPVKYTGEKGLVAKQLVDETNADEETGVATNAAWVCETSEVEISYSYAKIAESIAGLGRGQIGASAADGFDWVIQPIEYAAGKIGRLRIGTMTGGDPDSLDERLIGRTRAAASFELGPGTRNNIEMIRIPTTRDGLANRIFHAPDEATPVESVESGSSVIDRGLHEEILRDPIYDVTLRQDLLNGHLEVRRKPRRLIEVTPSIETGTGRVPTYVQDYDIGDVIPVLVRNEAGDAVIDIEVRIYGVATTINEAGQARHTLQLLPTG